MKYFKGTFYTNVAFAAACACLLAVCATFWPWGSVRQGEDPRRSDRLAPSRKLREATSRVLGGSSGGASSGGGSKNKGQSKKKSSATAKHANKPTTTSATKTTSTTTTTKTTTTTTKTITTTTTKTTTTTTTKTTTTTTTSTTTTTTTSTTTKTTTSKTTTTTTKDDAEKVKEAVEEEKEVAKQEKVDKEQEEKAKREKAEAEKKKEDAENAVERAHDEKEEDANKAREADKEADEARKAKEKAEKARATLQAEAAKKVTESKKKEKAAQEAKAAAQKKLEEENQQEAAAKKERDEARKKEEAARKKKQDAEAAKKDDENEAKRSKNEQEDEGGSSKAGHQEESAKEEEHDANEKLVQAKEKEDKAKQEKRKEQKIIDVEKAKQKEENAAVQQQVKDTDEEISKDEKEEKEAERKKKAAQAKEKEDAKKEATEAKKARQAEKAEKANATNAQKAEAKVAAVKVITDEEEVRKHAAEEKLHADKAKNASKVEKEAKNEEDDARSEEREANKKSKEAKDEKERAEEEESQAKSEHAGKEDEESEADKKLKAAEKKLAQAKKLAEEAKRIKREAEKKMQAAKQKRVAAKRQEQNETEVAKQEGKKEEAAKKKARHDEVDKEEKEPELSKEEKLKAKLAEAKHNKTKQEAALEKLKERRKSLEEKMKQAKKEVKEAEEGVKRATRKSIAVGDKAKDALTKTLDPAALAKIIKAVKQTKEEADKSNEDLRKAQRKVKEAEAEEEDNEKLIAKKRAELEKTKRHIEEIRQEITDLKNEEEEEEENDKEAEETKGGNLFTASTFSSDDTCIRDEITGETNCPCVQADGSHQNMTIDSRDILVRQQASHCVFDCRQVFPLYTSFFLFFDVLANMWISLISYLPFAYLFTAWQVDGCLQQTGSWGAFIEALKFQWTLGGECKKVDVGIKPFWIMSHFGRWQAPVERAKVTAYWAPWNGMQWPWPVKQDPNFLVQLWNTFLSVVWTGIWLIWLLIWAPIAIACVLGDTFVCALCLGMDLVLLICMYFLRFSMLGPKPMIAHTWALISFNMPAWRVLLTLVLTPLCGLVAAAIAGPRPPGNILVGIIGAAVGSLVGSSSLYGMLSVILFLAMLPFWVSPTIVFLINLIPVALCTLAWWFASALVTAFWVFMMLLSAPFSLIYIPVQYSLVGKKVTMCYRMSMAYVYSAMPEICGPLLAILSIGAGIGMYVLRTLTAEAIAEFKPIPEAQLHQEAKDWVEKSVRDDMRHNGTDESDKMVNVRNLENIEGYALIGLQYTVLTPEPGTAPDAAPTYSIWNPMAAYKTLACILKRRTAESGLQNSNGDYVSRGDNTYAHLEGCDGTTKFYCGKPQDPSTYPSRAEWVPYFNAVKPWGKGWKCGPKGGPQCLYCSSFQQDQVPRTMEHQCMVRPPNFTDLSRYLDKTPRETLLVNSEGFEKRVAHSTLARMVGAAATEDYYFNGLKVTEIFGMEIIFRPEIKLQAPSEEANNNKKPDAVARCFSRVTFYAKAIFPCFDNYSDMAQSITFLRTGRPSYFTLNLMGILWNVAEGLILNPPDAKTARLQGLDIVGRCFQADVIEATIQMIRLNRSTRLYYTKKAVQAHTESLMGLPVLLICIFELEHFKAMGNNWYPSVGTFFKSHGFPVFGEHLQFWICCILVIGDIGMLTSAVLSLSSMLDGIGEAPQWVDEFMKAEREKKPFDSSFKIDYKVKWLRFCECVAVTGTLSWVWTSHCMELQNIYKLCFAVSFMTFLPQCYNVIYLKALQYAKEECESNKRPAESAKADYKWLKPRIVPIAAVGSVCITGALTAVWPLHPYCAVWTRYLPLRGPVTANHRNTFAFHYLVRSGVLAALWLNFLFFWPHSQEKLPAFAHVWMQVFTLKWSFAVIVPMFQSVLFAVTFVCAACTPYLAFTTFNENFRETVEGSQGYKKLIELEQENQNSDDDAEELDSCLSLCLTTADVNYTRIQNEAGQRAAE